MIAVGLFKKKNQQQTETEVKDPNEGIKESILTALNSKLNGTLYDNCIIMPKGFTIDVQIGRKEEKDDIKLLQAIFIVKNDEFDEPLIDPVDAQGKTENEVAQMAADIFFAGVWHPLDQSIQKRNPIRIPVDYLRQHYDFDLFCQSVVRIGVKDKQPVMLMNFIKDEIPKFLGSKKYYWIRVNLAKFKDKKNIEIRINGSVCPTLSQFFNEYVDSWEENEGFTCEKQYAICVQREDDKCPFNKELVMECARFAIGKMENINSREDYIDMAKQLEEMAADKNLASEIRIFIPEIMAKLTLGYREGDSLFFIEGDGEEQTKIEFKKTQLRSYFYLQQAVLEYLSSRPDNDKVTRIVTNSVAFREMKKAVDAGHKPEELYVPGTSYRISDADYKVW
ncbi:MAG TPA: DUF6348 family protein [Ruminococcus sp.]